MLFFLLIIYNIVIKIVIYVIINCPLTYYVSGGEAFWVSSIALGYLKKKKCII